MPNLANVFMVGNECINENFKDRNKLAKLNELVTKKCGFSEVTTQAQSALLTKANQEKEKCQQELTSLKTENLILEAKFNATETAKAQVTLVKDIYEKLDTQRNEVFTTKSAEFRNAIELKTRESEDLLKQIQSKDAQIADKTLKISKLNERLSGPNQLHWFYVDCQRIQESFLF